jgi:hypothetical protein
MITENTEIPLRVKEQLLELSRKLPEDKRSQFISRTSAKIEALGLEYENTLFYAAVGWVLGEIMEHLTTIPFTHIKTMDEASETGALIGGLFGLLKDRKAKAKDARQAKQIAEIVRQEIINTSGMKA